jgi:hypothetical protein
VFAKGSRLHCIVFSRDRALQLDAFLASVSVHAPQLFTDVTILFRPSSDRHAEAYALLESEHTHVRWVRESQFRDDLLGVVGDSGMTVFHTDDDVYFRTPGPFEVRDDEVCFSLRLGLNTTYSYSLDVDQRLVGASVVGGRLAWDWRSQGAGELSYPLAVNGHVFRGEEVCKWVGSAQFTNPNTLESALQFFNSDVRPRMACFRHSVVVSVPANLVNETNVNRHGELGSADELNERFLAGERIDIGAMDFSDVRAAHQEIPFVFREVI